MDSLKNLCALDKQTIIIIVLCIIIAVLLYLNNNRTNEFNARLNDCGCSTEHLVNIGNATIAQPNAPNAPNSPSTSKLVVYYTDWCGHSQTFLKEWETNLLPLVQSANDVNTKVEFVKVDCDKNEQECKKNNVDGFPTIKFHSADGSVYEYNDDRTSAKIMAFVRKHI